MRARLASRLGVAAPCPDDMIGSLAALALPDDPQPGRVAAYQTPLQTALVEKHRVQVPIVVWPTREKRWVRISSQIYNRPAEYDRLAEALVAELAAERR
jgi:isopenicillin-N epimerase